jgi:hypothetical protein
MTTTLVTQTYRGFIEQVDRRKRLGRRFTVECDEVYVVAGHKGHPEAVKKKGDPLAEDG